MEINYYLTFDSPVPYRNLKIYPVTVKDYLYFTTYSQCLTLEKNYIPDVKIISMSELEYIYYSTEKEPLEKPYLFWFDRLLHLCLKEDVSFENISESMKRYKYDDNKKPYFVISDEKYFPDDFLEIKKIISMQNLIELPDETISKEVKDSLKKAEEYKKRMSGTKQASFEDYILSLASVTGWTLEYIYSMSARKFIKTLKRTDNLIHYKIYLAASMSGMVEFKDKSFIKHWLSDIDNDDKYKDVTMDLDAMKSKMSLEGAKK